MAKFIYIGYDGSPDQVAFRGRVFDKNGAPVSVTHPNTVRKLADNP